MKYQINHLRYEDIRQSVKDYLIQRNDLEADFDFEGSNIKYNLDLVSFMVMQFSYYSSMRANSVFMDTTELRKNAVSTARSFNGYNPKRKISSRFSIRVEYIDLSHTFTDDDKIVINARTQFTSSPNNYSFTNIEPIILSKSVGEDHVLSAEVSIVEGSFRKFEELGTGEKYQKIHIASSNVDNDNVNVSVYDVSDPDNKILWSKVDSFFTSDESNIYFIQEDITNNANMILSFGDGELGNIPQNDEIIEVEYLFTLGKVGNGEVGIAFADTPSPDVVGFSYDPDKLSVYAPIGTKSAGGKDEETLEEIQFIAPKFYSMGGRGVNEHDVGALLKEWDSLMEYYNKVEGSILFPNEAGKAGFTYLTGIPHLSYDSFLNSDKIYLSEIEENSILPSFTERSVIGTKRNFVKPTYLYVDVQPYIEVDTKLKTEEKNIVQTNSWNNVKTYEEENFRGFEKKYRMSQLSSAISRTNGVKGVDLESSLYFILNYDSFYNTRYTQLNLPVKFDREVTGELIYDENRIVQTSNYIKKRTDIIDEENERRTDEEAYTQDSLPIEKSSIYGALTHLNSDRYLYNKDISEIVLAEFELLGTDQTEILSFRSKTFKNQDETEFISSIFEMGHTDEDESGVSYRQWRIQLNGQNICLLSEKYLNGVAKQELSITVEGTEENFLNSIGFIEFDDNAKIKVNKIEEVDESGYTSIYYSIVGVLTNLEISNLFIDGKTKLANAIFDPISFQWTFTDVKTLYSSSTDVEGTTIIPKEDEYNENFVEFNNIIAFSLKNSNGTFSLRNFLDSNFLGYGQRNDLEFFPNYTLDQVSVDEIGTTVEYEIGSIEDDDTPDVEFGTIIYLSEQKVIDITTDNNTGGQYYAKGFYLNAPINSNIEYGLYGDGSGNPYYIYFEDELSPIDVSVGGDLSFDQDIAQKNVDGTVILVPVGLDGSGGDETASHIATRLKATLESLTNSGGTEADFQVTYNSLDQNDTTLTIQYQEPGKVVEVYSETDTTIADNFTFVTFKPGAFNSLSDITSFKEGDFLTLSTSDSELNDGTFYVYNSTPTKVYVYNYNRSINRVGTGVVTQWRLTSGIYGDYDVNLYDLFHDISIGTLNYETGNINFYNNIKGYIDTTNTDTDKVLTRTIKEIFNNYTESSKMDQIKIIPINKYNAEGDYIGPQTDFDSRFNTVVISNIKTPNIRK